jgi:hypothetical protein
LFDFTLAKTAPLIFDAGTAGTELIAAGLRGYADGLGLGGSAWTNEPNFGVHVRDYLRFFLGNVGIVGLLTECCEFFEGGFGGAALAAFIDAEVVEEAGGLGYGIEGGGGVLLAVAGLLVEGVDEADDVGLLDEELVDAPVEVG